MSDPLSNDVLSEIFFHCLPQAERIAASHFPQSVFLTLSVETAPVLLCRVCVRWQVVAIATPMLLWDRLHVDDPGPLWRRSLIPSRPSSPLTASFLCFLRPLTRFLVVHLLASVWSVSALHVKLTPRSRLFSLDRRSSLLFSSLLFLLS
jgi:hypothetical protein